MAASFIYACIAGGGLLFLLLSLLVGGGDHGDGSSGGGHTDGVHVAGDGASHSFDDLGSWFSLNVLAAFAIGFGAAGAGASVLVPGSPLVSAGWGIAVGMAMAVLARWLVQLFVRNQASSHVVDSQIMGQAGVVSQTILAGRAGEVEVGGVFRPARAADEMELKVGTAVRVIQMGATLVVEPSAPSKKSI